MGGGTSGGLSTITVRVTYQQNHRAAPALRVELISPYGGMVDLRTTDGNGGATFDKVSSGRYRVRVSGPDIDTTTTDLIETGGSLGGPYVIENIEVRLNTVGAEAGGAPAAIMCNRGWRGTKNA